MWPAAIPVVDALVVEGVRTTSTCVEASGPSLRGDDAVVRATGILALGAVAVIHFAQVVSTVEQTPWLGAAFVTLTIACLVLAAQLLQKGSRFLWAQVGLLNLSAIGGYVFTRLFSTFVDNTDVGNWSEMLGLAALFIEGSLVLLSTQIVVGTLSATSHTRHAGAGTFNHAVVPAESATAADAIAS
jgi:hypothetical protein